MRKRTFVHLMRALVVLVLLSAALAAAGCGGDDPRSGIDKDVAAVMKKIPRGAEMFAWFDVAALRSDNDLAPISQGMMGEWDTAFQALGIALDDIDAVGLGSEETLVFDGSFDLGGVRDALDEGGMDDDEYLDVEVWEAGRVGAALVSDGCIIFQTDGDIEDCIDAMKGKKPSAYDDEDITGTVGRLPAGLIVLCGVEGQGPFGELGFDDLEVTAASIAKRDASTISVALVMQFEDEDAVDDALDEIEDNLKEGTGSMDPDSVEIEQDGRYVEINAEAGVNSFPF